MDILVIDDDEVDFLHIQRLLNKAFASNTLNIRWVQNPSNVDLADEIEASEICIVDQNIGAYSGIDLINKFQTNGSLIPMILLTGEGSVQIDRQASEVGASDYLVKGELTPELLNRAIRFSITQKLHERKLTKLAFTDGLTGVANRAKFDETLDMLLYSRSRNDKFLALFIIDLDDFKTINDTLGHQAGDALLVEISKRLDNVVRRSDTVARLGGDEFGVIIDGYKQEEDILIIRDKILSAFEDPVTFNQDTIVPKASVGVAVLTPEQKKISSFNMLQSADNALYAAKRQGKNGCMFYDDETLVSLEQELDFQKELKAAVNNKELELVFQPKVCVGQHNICGAEALSRWNRQNGEQISPNVFIPLAEKSSCIIDIGRWVIEEACRKIRTWIDNDLDVVPISINVSPLQMQSHDFVAHIKENLVRYSVDPELLELEITETALMENLPVLAERLQELANHGCKWVIDDFGVGYSSLSRLQELPISAIKIDRSFVEKIETSQTSLKICNVVISLAEELDLSLVIEGIETSTQMELLSLRDENALQGFLFSEPLEEWAFKDWLAGNQLQLLPIPRRQRKSQIN